MRRRPATVAAGACLVALGASAKVPGDAPPRAQPVVRVRASAPLVPCMRPVFDAFAAASGIAVRDEVGDPGDVAGVDVVVGDDDELTRALAGC